ncbi:MAG: rod shape-determining protein MreD, partial [Firmicutes bacterium]|nr:rod shape-determining protein MreD [Bacillota bacterium]
MTRIIAWAAVLILNLVLGASLLPEIAIGGILPDITLLLVFSAGFLRGSYEGAFVGMAAGFLYDIFFGTMLGANGLILMLLGALAGRAAEGLRGGGFVVPVSLGGIFSLLYNAVIYVAFFMFSGDMGFIFYFIHLMLPAAIYSA